MRRSAIALAAAVGGALLAPAAPLADEPPTPPTAALEAQSTTVAAGQPIELDSSKSQPGTGAIVGHVWDLDGNGSFETDSADKAKVETTPEKPGPLTVRVRVVDDRGLNSDARLDLTVTGASKMEAAAPSVGHSAPAEETRASGPGVSSPTTETAPPGEPGPSPAAHDPSAAPPPAPQPPAPTPGATQPAAGDQPALEPMTTTRMSSAPAFVPTEALASGRTDSVVVKAATGATVTAAAASTGVTIKDFKFAPASSSVHVGDTITWTNQDVTPHTATASDGSFDTGQLSQGKSGSHTFTKAGTFAYICAIHPTMHGTVVVAAAAGGGTGSGSSPGSGGTTPTPSASANTGSSGGNLPHTGLDIAAVVLLAALMMGTGAALRRTAH